MEEENDMPLMLRMRDDAISTKDKQLAIVTSQNDQLRASLEQVEAELGDLLETLVKKDKELQKLQRTLNKRERELARLRVMESQAAGKDQAMEVLGKQNATLLKLLETKEDESRNLTIENGGMRDELKRQTFFSEKRVAKAAHQNERIKHTLREESLHARFLADERDGLATSLAGAEAERALVKLEAKAELACVADELVARRDGQYDLMLRLQHADDSTRRVADKLESQRNATDEARARAAELQSRLDAALARLRAAEGESARERAKAAADAASQRKELARTESERAALEAKLHDTTATLVALVAKHERLEQEAKARGQRADALARDARVAGERADARERERDAARDERDRSRMAGKRTSDALDAVSAQLEAAKRKTRDAMTGLPSAIGSVGESSGAGHLKFLSVRERNLLRDEAAARRRLLALYARAVAGRSGTTDDGVPQVSTLEAGPPPTSPALSAGTPLPPAALAVRPPCVTHIALGGCTLDDEDAGALAAALAGAAHVKAIELHSNRFTDRGAIALAPLLGSDGGLAALERFDVRNNRLSNDGIRRFARAVEANAVRGVVAVLARRDGRIDGLRGAGAGAAVAAGGAGVDDGSAPDVEIVLTVDARDNTMEGELVIDEADEKKDASAAALAKRENKKRPSRKQQRDAARDRELVETYGGSADLRAAPPPTGELPGIGAGS